MVRKLDIHICPKNPVEDIKKLIREIRPKWDVEKMSFKVYDKSNVNTLVSCHINNQINQAIAVKIKRSEMSSYVNRMAEIRGNELIHKRGYAAKVLAIFQNGFCYSFLHGDTLDINLARDEMIWKNVARGLAVIHTTNMSHSTPKKSSIFQILYKYIKLLPNELPDSIKNQKYKSFFPTKENLKQELLFVEEYLNNNPSKIVYCHGDPRLDNILWNSAKRKIMFLDFEFADYNYQAYEVAAHFLSYAGLNESPNFDLCPDENFQLEWLREYLKCFTEMSNAPKKIEQNDVQKLYSQVQKYSLLTHMMMIISGILGSAVSTMEFDFFEYGMKRAEKYFKQKDLLLKNQTI